MAEYKVVINDHEIVHVSGELAAWTKFAQAKEMVDLVNVMTGRDDAWAQLIDENGIIIADYDEMGQFGRRE
nr:MAG TPA: hypothetical protein [Caudoviricetes sp.]